MPVESTEQACWPEELERLRDERDLYRTLLRSPSQALRQFLAQNGEQRQRLQETLNEPARDVPAFRGKIEALSAQVQSIHAGLQVFEWPSVQRRLEAILQRLAAIHALPEPSGDELLPALEMTDDLFNHFALAIELAGDDARQNAPIPHPPDGSGGTTNALRAPDKLTLALQTRAGELASEYGKQIEVNAIGLDTVPFERIGMVFDMLMQLLRNAVEFGVESPGERVLLHKPPAGTLLVEYRVDRQGRSRLLFQDDGRGLDAQALWQCALERGQIEPAEATQCDPRRLAGLIFLPGITTGGAQHRGVGLQIVRDHVRRLGGRMEVASKRGHFCRFTANFAANDGTMSEISVTASAPQPISSNSDSTPS